MVKPHLYSGHRYRLSAVEWMLRVAGQEGLTKQLRDFAIALDKHSAFAALTQSDAHHIAVAIVVDVLNHDEPAEPLQQRLRALLSGEDAVTWEDPHTAYQTLAIAVQIATINR